MLAIQIAWVLVAWAFGFFLPSIYRRSKALSVCVFLVVVGVGAFIGFPGL